ncbi:gycosyl hydrolase [Proteus mirabilis]|uniref:Gycosyl hydrolase n=1 Tax=Proteus mirabilis TaxID=584 RepID=A0A2X2BG26_PROMI|nr:gycosyl hydrolase [Proteus mirabilis]
MAPPGFAALAEIISERRYLDYMHTAYWDAIEHLRDAETGLIFPRSPLYS